MVYSECTLLMKQGNIWLLLRKVQKLLYFFDYRLDHKKIVIYFSSAMRATLFFMIIKCVQTLNVKCMYAWMHFWEVIFGWICLMVLSQFLVWYMNTELIYARLFYWKCFVSCSYPLLIEIVLQFKSEWLLSDWWIRECKAKL